MVVNAQEAVHKTYYPLLGIRLYPPCTPASRRRKGLKKARSLVNSLEFSASCVGLRFAEKVAATPELTSAKEEKSSVEMKIVKRKTNREMIVYKLQSIHPEPAPSRSAAAIHPVRPSLSRAQLPVVASRQSCGCQIIKAAAGPFRTFPIQRDFASKRPAVVL